VMKRVRMQNWPRLAARTFRGARLRLVHGRALAWLCALLLLGVSAAFADRPLDLEGEIFTADGKRLRVRIVIVHLSGNNSPFTAETEALFGKFRFRNLPPGSYTVSVSGPGFTGVKQSVNVEPSFADRRGRVRVQLKLRESRAVMMEKGTVSARRLAIPHNAVEEYQRARRALGRPGEENVQRGIHHLQRAIEIAPEFIEAINHLGTVYYHKSEFQKAADLFSRALEVDGTAYDPLVNLGGVMINLGRYKEAVELNRSAISLRPDDALAHAQLGMSLFAVGELDDAIGHLNRAKRLDPAHFSHPQITLAEIYMRQDRKRDALVELEDFVRLHPDHPMTKGIRDGMAKLRKQLE
jgi:tetratricopeptide (TPR) repeat protein